jgi:hypothetical protein
LSGRKNGVSSISESDRSKVPEPGVLPGIKVRPAGSALGLSQVVVSMIWTIEGVSAGETAASVIAPALPSAALLT